MRTGLLFAILLHSTLLWAQPSVEDSLETELTKHHEQDTIRFNLLRDLCNNTYNLDRALEVSNEMISLATKLQLPIKKALAYFYRASTYLDQGKDSLFLIDLDYATDIYRKFNDKKGLAISLRGKGRYLEGRAQYTQAIEYYNEAIAAAREATPEYMMYINLDIGNCYANLSNFTKSTQYYLLCRKQAEDAENKKVQALAIDNLARINKEMKKFSSAIAEYKNAMKVYSQTKDSSGYAKALQGIGIVFDEQNKKDSALQYYFKAKEINTRIGNKLNLAENLSNIGTVYLSNQQYSTAYNCFLQATELFKELNRNKNLKEVQVSLGEIFLLAPASFFSANKLPLTHRYIEAEEIFEDILNYGNEFSIPSLQLSAWKNLAIVYEKKGDFKMAYKALNNYHLLDRSLINEEKIEETTKLTQKFDFDKKEAVMLAQHEIEIKHEQDKKKAIAIGAGGLFLGLFFLFLLYKRKRDAVLKQKEAEFKSEVIETEMKALRAQMNPHFIFNSLSSIGDYITKNNIPQASSYLTKFSKLMRNILENSEQKEVLIADDLKALELYMQLECMRLNNKFSYEIKIDDAIDEDAVLVPPLILQPFVENSIWHGIANKEGNGKICIYIKKVADNQVSYVVEDDGIGRKQTQALHTDIQAFEKTSLGLKITQARIDIFNRLKSSRASVKLTDLAQGMKVEVLLPLIKND